MVQCGAQMPALRPETMSSRVCRAVVADGSVFSKAGVGVRAEWQEWPKTLACLQRITATRFGSRWRSLQGGQAGRRLAHVGRLLVGVGEPQQLVFAPGAAGEGEAERIVRRILVAGARDEAGRHLHAGIARLGRNRGARDAG